MRGGVRASQGSGDPRRSNTDVDPHLCEHTKSVFGGLTVVV
jgi:hypothetical protein